MSIQDEKAVGAEHVVIGTDVRRMLWSVGQHLSAMLPCGNIGVYRKQDMTEVSPLNPRYMERILPDPAVRKASAMAETLLIEMVNEIGSN